MTPTPDSLSRALDDAIGDGPPLPPVTDHVAPGRKAVRRRSTGLAAGALAVAVVVGGTAFASTGLTSDAGETAPAASPSPSADPSSGPISYDRFGSLQIGPDAEFVDRVLDPVTPPPSGLTDAVAVRIDGSVRYFLMEWRSDRTTTVLATAPRSEGFPTLDRWLASQTDVPPEEEDRGERSPRFADLFRIDDQGHLIVPAGVEVQRTIDNPLALPPPRFSKGVVYRYDGKTAWSVVASLNLPGAPDVGAGGRTTLAGYGGETIEEWIASLPRTASGSVG